MNFEQLWNTVLSWLSTEGIKIVIAIVVLIISFQLINWLSRTFKKWCIKKDFDLTLGKILRHAIRIGLKCLVVVSLLGYLGIDTAGIAALVASLGVAIGLAVQGSLGNFAGGILIILLRPLRIGDFIEAQGVSGVVEDITIFYTYITTGDNKSICVPNGALANGNIINYSKKDIRRVDLTFSISYTEDFTRAQKAILEVCAANDKILTEPGITCRMVAHSESTIDIVTRVWTKNADYWSVYFDMLEQVKAKFDAEKIEIPFKQIDIHMDKQQ